MAALPTLYTFEEIAEGYGFSLRSMKERASAGEFGYVRFGNAWRMTQEQLDAFLAANTSEAKTAADPLASVRARRARRAQRPRRRAA